MRTILIVDDKLSITRLLQEYLGGEGYRTVVADNGRNALYTARHAKPDLILLDLMMPDMDGFEFLKSYRQEAETPIIMVTASGYKENALVGLDLGADDYITKPFDLEVLSARIKAVLRRYDKGSQSSPVLRIGDLELDRQGLSLAKRGQEITLTRSEFSLLRHLMEHPGRVFSRLELLEKLQEGDIQSGERTVDVHVRKLRTKLEDDPTHPVFIETVFGTGYRFNRRVNRS